MRNRFEQSNANKLIPTRGLGLSGSDLVVGIDNGGCTISSNYWD